MSSSYDCHQASLPFHPGAGVIHSVSSAYLFTLIFQMQYRILRIIEIEKNNNGFELWKIV